MNQERAARHQMTFETANGLPAAVAIMKNAKAIAAIDTSECPKDFQVAFFAYVVGWNTVSERVQDDVVRVRGGVASPTDPDIDDVNSKEARVFINARELLKAQAQKYGVTMVN